MQECFYVCNRYSRASQRQFGEAVGKSERQIVLFRFGKVVYRRGRYAVACPGRAGCRSACRRLARGIVDTLNPPCLEVVVPSSGIFPCRNIERNLHFVALAVSCEFIYFVHAPYIEAYETWILAFLVFDDEFLFLPFAPCRYAFLHCQFPCYFSSYIHNPCLLKKEGAPRATLLMSFVEESAYLFAGFTGKVTFCNSFPFEILFLLASSS